MRLNTFIIILGFGILFFSSCEKFLDERPRKSLALLRTLEDYQAIMDNETQYNIGYPAAGDFASDYYYLKNSEFNSLDMTTRFNYLWAAEPPHANNWNQSYSNKIYPANIVIEGIDHTSLGSLTEEDRSRIKGEAFFSRGFAFYHLAQIFAPPYQKDKAKALLGIPIRLTADINKKTTRANLEDTYLQILSDLKTAAYFLPRVSSSKVRPSKTAAYAALSKVYLVMQDFENSELFADSSLAIYNTLIDYNDLDISSSRSQFPVLNDEVVFHATRNNAFSSLGVSRANVDTLLFEKYELNDLRRSLFYRTNASGIRGFYGDYSGLLTNSDFSGIATDEIYLTSAECKIRNGNLTGGLKALNELLVKRYKKGTYTELNTSNSDEALYIVLNEREKQLAFRSGVRWSDLRRLNLEPKFAKTLYRTINGEVFTLKPNDKRYTFKIPERVIELTGIEQND